jgi:hypothetical protein
MAIVVATGFIAAWPIWYAMKACGARPGWRRLQLTPPSVPFLKPGTTAAGELAVALAFGGARANRAHQVADELRAQANREILCRPAGSVEQQLARHFSPSLMAKLPSRCGSLMYPADGGARLFKIRASRSANRPAVSAGFELAGVVHGLRVVMDGTRRPPTGRRRRVKSQRGWYQRLSGAGSHSCGAGVISGRAPMRRSSMRVVSWVEGGVAGRHGCSLDLWCLGSSARQESADSYLFNSK